MKYKHPSSESDVDRIIQVDNIVNKIINNPHYRMTDYAHILMALDGDNCVGSVAFPVCGNECTVGTIGVLPEYSQRGIGKKMMKLVEEQVAKEGVRKIWTSTTAPGFFEKCGLKKERPSKGPWYAMRLEL